MTHPAEVRRILRILWLFAILVVTVMSLVPANSLAMRTLSLLHVNDKVEHCLAYAVLAFLPAIHEHRKFIIGAALGAVALGIALEYGQLLTGWRDFEYGDMVADAVGVCLGVAAAVPLRATEVARSVLFEKS